MKKINFIFFCSLIFFGALNAQGLFKFSKNKSKLYEEEDAKVGVILSGGGSRAFAHIGVLKEIERAGIRVDYIGGTSMGAVVGALYASGYTVHQIDSIFKSTDFSRLLQEKVSRSIKGPYEKMEEDRYALALPFDGFKPSLPSSLAKSQGLYNLMVQLLQPINQMNDFSKLPIPFYCMATNLETGDAVVLDSGYVPIALAATTAFPTLITPVSISSDLLVDGGVVDNFPIDEMLTKGMDYIIGVDVQQKLMTKDDIKNGTDVLMQVSSFYDHRTIVRKKKQTNVYISPKLGEYGLLDFDYRYEIIDEGEKAAIENRDILKEISRKQVKRIQVRKPQKISDSLTIKDVIIPDNMDSEMEFVKKRLGFVFNEPVALEKFFKSINTTLASDKYNEVYYRLIPSGDGAQLIDLRLQRRQESLFLKLGVHYDVLYKAGALVGLAKKQLIIPEDRFIFDAVIGDNVRYNLEYIFEPIGFWSLHFKSLYNSFNTNVFSDTSLSSRVFLLQNIDYTSSTLKNQLYGSIYFKSYAYFRFGFQHDYIINRTSNSFLRQFSSNNSDFNFENSHIISLFANGVIDKYDNVYFPRKGYFLDAKAHFYFSSTDLNRTFSPYSIVTLKSGIAFKINQSMSFKVEPSMGFSLGVDEDIPVPFQYRFGGYGNNFINNAMPFYNYDFYELWGNSFTRLDIAFDYNFIKIHHFTLEANYANLSTSTFNFQTNFALPKYNSYAIGYAADTFVGPITIKYTLSPDKENQLDLNSSNRSGKLMFSVGHWF